MTMLTAIEVVPCNNGLTIVFTRDDDGQWTLYDIAPDGTVCLSFCIGGDTLAAKLKPRRIANCGGERHPLVRRPDDYVVVYPVRHADTATVTEIDR